MEDLFNDVLIKFNGQTINSQQEELTPFNRNHIFFDIFKKATSNSSSEERMDMLYYFNCYEKSLSASRNRIYTVADYWLNIVNNPPLNLVNEFAQNGMMALYYPIIGFKSYVQEEYENAIVNIEEALKHIDNLIGYEFKEAIPAKMEQMLNLIRINLNLANNDAVEDITNIMFNYMIHNKDDKQVFKIDWASVYPELSERNSVLNYYYNSIFYKMIMMDIESIFDNTSLLSKVNTNILTSKKDQISNFQELENTLQIFELSSQNDIYNFCNLLTNNVFFNTNIPNSLRFILTERLLNIFHTFNYSKTEDFKKQLKFYYSDTLKIPNKIINMRNEFWEKRQLSVV